MPWAVGIDVGGSKIAGALVSDTGQTCGFQTSPVPAKGEPSVAAVKQMAKRLLALAAADKRPVAGVGLAVPGEVDIHRGVVLRRRTSTGRTCRSRNSSSRPWPRTSNWSWTCGRRLWGPCFPTWPAA